MELHPLRVFLTVATERSFSRAAEKLLRTQPAISLAIQRLEGEMGEKLIDRSAKDLLLTDAGQIVLEYARRFEHLQGDLENAMAELRDKSSGRLTMPARTGFRWIYLTSSARYRLSQKLCIVGASPSLRPPDAAPAHNRAVRPGRAAQTLAPLQRQSSRGVLR